MPKKERAKQTIPPHKHCIICGKAIPPDQQFCSSKCEETYNRYQRKMMIERRIFYGMLVIAMFIFFILLIAYSH